MKNNQTSNLDSYSKLQPYFDGSLAAVSSAAWTGSIVLGGSVCATVLSTQYLLNRLNIHSHFIKLCALTATLAIHFFAIPYVLTYFAIQSALVITAQSALELTCIFLASKVGSYVLFRGGLYLYDRLVLKFPYEVKEIGNMAPQELVKIKRHLLDFSGHAYSVPLLFQVALNRGLEKHGLVSLVLLEFSDLGRDWSKEELRWLHSQDITHLSFEKRVAINELFLHHDLPPQKRVYIKDELPEVDVTKGKTLSPAQVKWYYLTLQLDAKRHSTPKINDQFSELGLPPPRKDIIYDIPLSDSDEKAGSLVPSFNWKTVSAVALAGLAAYLYFSKQPPLPPKSTALSIYTNIFAPTCKNPHFSEKGFYPEIAYFLPKIETPSFNPVHFVKGYLTPPSIDVLKDLSIPQIPKLLAKTITKFNNGTYPILQNLSIATFLQPTIHVIPKLLTKTITKFNNGTCPIPKIQAPIEILRNLTVVNSTNLDPQSFTLNPWLLSIPLLLSLGGIYALLSRKSSIPAAIKADMSLDLALPPEEHIGIEIKQGDSVDQHVIKVNPEQVRKVLAGAGFVRGILDEPGDNFIRVILGRNEQYYSVNPAVIRNSAAVIERLGQIGLQAPQSIPLLEAPKAPQMPVVPISKTHEISLLREEEEEFEVEEKEIVKPNWEAFKDFMTQHCPGIDPVEGKKLAKEGLRIIQAFYKGEKVEQSDIKEKFKAVCWGLMAHAVSKGKPFVEGTFDLPDTNFALFNFFLPITYTRESSHYKKRAIAVEDGLKKGYKHFGCDIDGLPAGKRSVVIGKIKTLDGTDRIYLKMENWGANLHFYSDPEARKNFVHFIWHTLEFFQSTGNKISSKIPAIGSDGPTHKEHMLGTDKKKLQEIYDKIKKQAEGIEPLDLESWGFQQAIPLFERIKDQVSEELKAEIQAILDELNARYSNLTYQKGDELGLGNSVTAYSGLDDSVDKRT